MSIPKEYSYNEEPKPRRGVYEDTSIWCRCPHASATEPEDVQKSQNTRTGMRAEVETQIVKRSVRGHVAVKLQINLKLADKMLPPSVIRGIRVKLMQASARALWDEIA